MAPRPERPAPTHAMVGWYDPGQLLNTGVQVLISEVLGSRADYRLIESFGGAQEVFDYSAEAELWLDYVADLGDGWDSTYTVASMLAAERLSVRDSDGGTLELPRAHILVMGGDQVYPLASRDNYQMRTADPYGDALPKCSEPAPTLFAIPGNHDWYDGLISFSRLFCQQRTLGAWRTRQRRSYFAMRLPHNWWLWGLDYQLASDIDEPQMEYFLRAAEQMPRGAKLVLAVAEPDWIYGNIYDRKYQSNITYLQKHIIERTGATVKLAIAGDLHYYRHHAERGGDMQLIVSGGGGAFTLGTNGPRVETVSVGKDPVRVYDCKAEYPNKKTSNRLLRRNFLFPFINPKFGLVTGALYLAIAWIYRVPVLREYEQLLRSGDAVGGATALFRAVLSSPFGFGVLLLVVVGFVAFTDTHIRTYKYFAGTAHALANLGVLFLISAAASHFSHDALHLADGSIRYLLVTAGLIFAGGYAAGAVIMGLYLYISLRVFRRHGEEAYSALRTADYKHFVRLHINAQGELTIYPICVDRVPRRWRESQSEGPRFAPSDRKIEPRLIEPAIRVGDR